jgi:disulfide bond formation protein DsbB
MHKSRSFEWLALVLAAAMVAGSLHMSLGMGLKACPLCIYERTFAMGAAAVLLLGTTGIAASFPGLSSFLALPLAIAGLGVAAFHVRLEMTGVLLCPQGLFGLGRGPDQSLAGFLLLTGLLVAGARPSPSPEGRARRAVGLATGILLGGALAFACISSAPPLPPPSPKFGPGGERILAGCEPAGPPAPAAPAREPGTPPAGG